MNRTRAGWDFRRSLWVSASLHLAIFAVFWWLKPLVVDVALPGNLTVDLMGGPAAPAASSPAGPAAPVQAKAAPAPARDEVTAAPKKKPVKVETRKVESARTAPPAVPSKAPPVPSPSEAPPTTGPQAHIGTSGAPGSASDSRLGSYLLSVRNKIGENWTPPGVDRKTKATVAFQVDRQGRITDARVETSSGSGIYDQLALRAVKNASPLPPLPAFFTDNELGIHFDFELTH